MAYTTPPTKSAGDVLGATDWNTYVRDNSIFNFNGKAAQTISRDNGGDYTTSSSTFVDVDATNLSINMTCVTGRVLVLVTAHIYTASVAVDAYLDISIDGTRQGGNHGLTKHRAASNVTQDAHILFLKTGLSVGSHTFRLMWATAPGGTINMVSDSNSTVRFTVLEL